MLINKPTLNKIAHTLRESVYEIEAKARKHNTDIYVMYGLLDDAVYKAIKSQGKDAKKVNKLRTEAGMPDIVEEFNKPVFEHNHIGHVTKNAFGLGKGVTFTASHLNTHIKVPAWLKKEAQKIAEQRGLDFHASDTNIYLGVKESDAVLQ